MRDQPTAEESDDASLTVLPPVGGYVIAIFGALATFMMVFALASIVREEGILYGIAFLTLGIVIFTVCFPKMGLLLNQDAQEFRSFLRSNHYILFSVGIVSRVVYIAFVALYVGATAMLEPAVFWELSIVGISLLMVASTISVVLSSMGNLFVNTSSSPTP